MSQASVPVQRLLLFCAAFFFLVVPSDLQTRLPQDAHGVLGFDTNEYPGDAALPRLHPRFAFSGYWLNAPPGSASNTWAGKRAILREQGFGFLVLFDGRSEKVIKRAKDAAALGSSDGRAAIESAAREG